MNFANSKNFQMEKYTPHKYMVLFKIKMDISVAYRVKYFIKRHWEVTEQYKFFSNKEQALIFFKGIDQLQQYPQLTNRPCIEVVGVVSDGTNSYSLGPAITMEM